VASGPARRRASRGEQRQAVTAFLAAARSGDLDGLLAVLAPDVRITGDGGGVFPAGKPVEGAVPAARFIAGLFRRIQTEVVFDIEPALVNGDVGVVIEIRPLEGRDLAIMEGIDLVRIVMVFDVGADGRIAAIFDQLNPDKLARLPALADLRVTTPG
jgi:RNA polymerase sigma-70 factor (ECF subfamily)